MAASRGPAVRRAGQIFAGFGALVVLCAVLAGAPVALLAFAGNPLPDHLPTLAEVGTTLTSRDDGQLFLRALAVLGWFGWATFAFSVLVELGAQTLRRPAPRLPGMRRQQKAAAALVGSVALILAAAPAASAATVASAPHPAVATLPVTPHAGPSTAGTHLTTAPSTWSAGRAAGTPVYRVAEGDYLGDVAERYLDDFGRYREVAALNRLPDADRIQPGQLIKLPARADDTGARRHATGRLVEAGSTPRRPSPHPPAATPPAPEGHAGPDTSSPGGPATGPHARPSAGPETGPHAGPTAGPQTRPHAGPTAGPQTRPHAGPTTGPKAGPSAGPQPGRTSVANPGGAAGPSRGGNAGRPTPNQQPLPPAAQPAGAPPAMAAGAARATDDDGMNRPLAVSAVLAVASIVGAQIGAVLGLRRRPLRTARALISGRHRRD